MLEYPKGFLWGAAAAGHQVEGNNVAADLWLMEHADPSIFVEPSGDACDHYHRYAEDIALLACLGLNAYRFSVEWSRVEPEEDHFSRAELDHYRGVAATCLEHGVTPIVTLSHFTGPRWFAGNGGWEADQAPERFARYAEKVTAALGDLVPYMCTLNEPNVGAVVTATGAMPLGASDSTDFMAPFFRGAAARGGYDPETFRPAIFAAGVDKMAAAHRAAAQAIKSGPGEVKVGWTLALIDLQLAEGGEERLARARQVGLLDWLEVSREDDFVGVQTYTRENIGADGVVPHAEGTPVTQTGWEIYPQALEHSVRLAAEHAGVPVLVTENGMATDDDEARIAHTDAALRALHRCVSDGIDVRAYLHWTLLDNFEWMSGFAVTFGLIAVDRETFERTPKPSAGWLGQIARSNGLPEVGD